MTRARDLAKFNLDGQAVTINESSADLDFRVESNGNANMLFVDGGNNAVGIGAAASSNVLDVTGANSATVSIIAPTDNATLELRGGNSDSAVEEANLVFYQNNAAKWQFGNATDNSLKIYNYATSSYSFVMDATGAMTKPNQPFFFVRKNANQNNIAASTHTFVSFQTENFDVGSNFASDIFTAPVTGKYLLGVSLLLSQPAQDAGYIGIRIKTSNRDYRASIQDYVGMDAELEYWSINGTFVCDMDANDTSYIDFYQSGGTAQTDIIESADTTNFFGYLLG
tara:strand:- start:372 stop:1217 length:846 start_codon:yes stop_codon:yes gene_type:complete